MNADGESRDHTQGREKTKLPGLTLVFVFYLWLFTIGCFLGALYLANDLVSETYYAHFALLFFALTCMMIWAGILCWRAASSIHARDERAPARCRFLLVLNIIAAIINLGLLLWFARYEGRSLLNLSMGQKICVQLSSVIHSEAWRRYFLLSPKVRAAFNITGKPLKDSPMPDGLCLLKMFCWLGFVFGGLYWAIAWADPLAPGEDTQGFFYIRAAGNCVSGFIAPAVTLYALSAAGKNHSLAFWGLGIWIFFAFIDYIAQLKTTFFPLAQLVLPLVFWWYLYVSDKAKEWFRETPRATSPSWEIPSKKNAAKIAFE